MYAVHLDLMYAVLVLVCPQAGGVWARTVRMMMCRLRKIPLGEVTII